MENRTVKNLSEQDGRVYVYLANGEIGEKFLKQAKKEGFAFEDGVKPTKRHYSTVMAVNKNFTVNYVNSVGNIAFGSGADKIGGEKLIRVDFEKYINGEPDYYFNGKH